MIKQPTLTLEGADRFVKERREDAELQLKIKVCLDLTSTLRRG